MRETAASRYEAGFIGSQNRLNKIGAKGEPACDEQPTGAE